MERALLLLLMSLMILLFATSTRAADRPNAAVTVANGSGESSQAREKKGSKATAAQASPPQIEVVVTGTRSPEQAQRAVLHTGLVTREEAERRGASNVGEALAGELRLQVNSNAYANLGSPAGVQIQGFDAERVLILQDGERVIGDLGGVVDLDAFPLTDVERIEYVAGPSSSLYGAGALGGVVNIVSGAPKAEGASGRGRYEVRSLPSYLFENTTSYRVGPHWGSIDTTYQHQDGLRLFEDRPDLSLPEREQLAFGTRLGTTFGESVDTMVQAGFSREQARGLLSEEFPGLERFFVDLPSRTNRYRLRNVDTWRFGDGHSVRASLSSQWFINRSEKDRRDSPLDEVRFRDHQLSSGEVTTTLIDGSRTWVFGARGERETFEQRLERKAAEQGSVVNQQRLEVEPVTLAYGAGYAQLVWKLGSRFTLVPGGRFEYHKRFGSVVAPRLAAAFRPNETWQLRASLGRGFRVPSAKEYGFLFDHSFLGYRVIGNEDLAPESSWGLNAEVGFAPNARVRLRASGFVNWVTDLIAIDFLGQQIPGVDDFTFVNVGSATTAGVEGMASVGVWPGFRSELGYAFLHTRDNDNDEPLASRPKHTIVASLVWQPLSDVEILFRQRSVSQAFLAEGLNTPGFITLDARVAYLLVDGFRLYGGALNLLDAQDDPLRAGDQRPVVGRLFLVGLSGSFAREEN